ncbi:fibrobacter succinogenes major paralogous domain-containing protein [Flavihumibacter fluvii]|uniref:fibrobacter succinogenes major paralogous domain-containing protein n=1 Tax=Flavihumibacter fluvii TaxID=2838157 RepID=UPI001BDEA292|nr:fibrobacter succinogenes major paralogous domain-containing protein [Flavihumibacter fluvii]ULQ54705.1 fibrobacter succinogenes major paralogous domain-containing protein [Flavihumibacter fluvii]
MKKILLPMLSIILLASCEKQISVDKSPEDIGCISEKKPEKINACHFDGKTGNPKTISISVNAWPAHQAHGDLKGDCSAVMTKICDQFWMVKNLDVATYRNGDIIPQVKDANTWFSLTSGAWCYYLNLSENGPIYGKLYNWYAVNDPRGLAPVGWHVPTETDVSTLSNCLGGDLVAGAKMMETGTAHWPPPNSEATNSSGFTGLPGGTRSKIALWGGGGYYWTSTVFEYDADYARYFILGDHSKLIRNFTYTVDGASVRCVKD